MAWKIKADAVAVPRAIFTYVGEDGSTKYRHISTVHTKDEVVSDEMVSPLIAELYEAGDESVVSSYERVSDSEKTDKPPFDGYNDLDEYGVRARMINMPSDDVQEVKLYEREHLNRENIVDYVIGHGQSPNDRLDGTLLDQSEYANSPTLATAKDLVTPKASTKAQKEVTPGADVDVVAVPAKPVEEVKTKARKRSVNKPQSEE